LIADLESTAGFFVSDAVKQIVLQAAGERVVAVEIELDAEWDAFVTQHPQGSLLQLTSWARLKNRFGWSSQRVWMRKNGRLVAGAQILFRSAALGMVKMGYIPHGPLVDWSDREQVTVLFNQIDQAAFQRGAGIVKMEPRVWQVAREQEGLETRDWETERLQTKQSKSPISNLQSPVSNLQWFALCAETGCVTETDTIQPPRTILVDLRSSEADILAAMKQKTRYNIRLAEKKGVAVRMGTAADLPVFHALMQMTGQRDSFGIHDFAYYRAAYELFAPTQAALIMADYEGKPLAGVMVFTWGETAAYLYGASSNEERQRMPTYAAQWAAMCWAKARGCNTYDLWGIPDAPEAELEAHFTDRTGDLWPVYRFKRGFGDRVYNRLLHRLYQWRRGR